MPAVLFLAGAFLIAATWNRFFERIPWHVVALMIVLVMAHQSETLLTRKTQFPGNLAYVAYPWKALDRSVVRANTGIIFTQIAPWAESVRRSVRSGELPLWNRHSASGTPLLANQQTAFFHPLTLVTLPLSTADALTVSAALRLFVSLFFLFVFLRNWSVHPLPALFGATAYTFSTFSIVWLLFPLGLATLAVVPGLAAVDEFFRRPRRASFLALTLAFTLPILGGHPEQALWVGLTLAAYGGYMLWRVVPHAARARILAQSGASALLAVALTAVWWLPTLEILPHTSRYAIMKTVGHGPVDLPAAWTWTLVAPNVLGTPQAGNYIPPSPRFPTLLDDYGEIASGYAGVLSLGLALPMFFRRHGPSRFFAGTALFALLTVTQAPLFYPALRSIPLIDLSLDQRLRFLWALSVAILGALALDALVKNTRANRRLLITLVASLVAAGTLSAYAYATSDRWPLAATCAVIAVVIGATTLLVNRPIVATAVLALATLCELSLVTWRYNPASAPEDFYPVTGAIAAMQRSDPPYRIAALGWSLLPETPNAYGLEDLKTTDPISSPRYLRLLLGYLQINPGDYDQTIGNVTEPFFDFLNVRFLYVPPGHGLPAGTEWREVYRGLDGVVLENDEVLPRYQFVRDFIYEPSFDVAVARLKTIRDFSQSAIVDTLPKSFEAADHGARLGSAGASASLLSYRNNGADLRVKSDGWNLLVSSDVAWPGWRASLNDRTLPVVTVNGAFVGVFVPPGEGVLRLHYAPSGFRYGAFISLLAVGFTIFVAYSIFRGAERGSVRGPA